MTMFKVLSETEADSLDYQSWKVGELTDIKYNDLVRKLGEPTLTKPSGDDKVQLEWIIQHNDQIFTVYDWKTYNKNYTLNVLTEWSIGGSTDPTNLITYINNL